VLASLVLQGQPDPPDARWVGRWQGVVVATEAQWQVGTAGAPRVARRLHVAFRAGTRTVSREDHRVDAPPLAPWSADLAWTPWPTTGPWPSPGDVLTTLVHPADPAARGAREVTFAVDGASRVQRVPLAIELPSADRARWATRTRAVAASGAAVRRAPGGDCAERAAAWAAAAAAAGEVARVQTGFALVDGVLGPGLYPHAWVEVDTPQGPVPIDPTLDQLPADATHLAVPIGVGSLRIVSFR
jgi:hypothetical protein